MEAMSLKSNERSE